MPRGYDIFDQADIERRLLPPSTAIRGYNNLVLFLAGSGIRTTESIIDISPTTKPLTLNGGVTISNTQADPYGTNNGVLSLNGTNDQIQAASSADFTLGGIPAIDTSDFTIGFWVYFNSLSSASQYLPIATSWADAASGFSGRWFIGLFNGSLRWFNDAGNASITDASTPTATWVNYMVVRSGSTITLYKNGVAIGTQTTAQNYTTEGGVNMGFVTSGGAYLNAFVYNFRIFRGAAIQTTNFPLMTRTQVEAQIATAAYNVNNRRAFSNRVLGFNSAYVNRPFLAGDGVNPQLWSPIQLSPALWLDAADSSTITLSGGNVTQWNDKSGNARNLTQTTPAQQPTYQATGLNSSPTVRFDGINDFMRTTAYSFGNSPSFAYAVFQSSNAAGSAGQIFMAFPNPANPSIGTELLYINNIGGYTTITLKPPSLATTTLGANPTLVTTPQIIGAGFDGSGTSPSDVEFMLNGTQQTSTTSGAVGYQSEIGFSIGNRPIQQNTGLNGTISELIFFDSFISTTNRQLVEGYLAWKWGLQASLPANHPYRNSPPTTNV